MFDFTTPAVIVLLLLLLITGCAWFYIAVYKDIKNINTRLNEIEVYVTHTNTRNVSEYKDDATSLCDEQEFNKLFNVDDKEQEKIVEEEQEKSDEEKSDEESED